MSMNVCNMKTIAAKARTENVINAQVIALCRRQRRRLRRNSLHWRLAQNVFHKMWREREIERERESKFLQKSS